MLSNWPQAVNNRHRVHAAVVPNGKRLAAGQAGGWQLGAGCVRLCADDCWSGSSRSTDAMAHQPSPARTLSCCACSHGGPQPRGSLTPGCTPWLAGGYPTLPWKLLIMAAKRQAASAWRRAGAPAVRHGASDRGRGSVRCAGGGCEAEGLVGEVRTTVNPATGRRSCCPVPSPPPGRSAQTGRSELCVLIRVF